MDVNEDPMLPVRTAPALRHEVARRVAHRRRRRAVARAASLAAVGLVWAVAANAIPGMPTSVGSTHDGHVPAAEGPLVVGAGGAARFVEPSGTSVDRGSTDAEQPRPSHAPAPSSAGPAGKGNPTEATAAVAGSGPTRLAVTRPDGIWELRDDGAPVARLTTGGSHPAWSPDGRKLAYTKRWDGINGAVGVAVLELDTKESRFVLMASDADYFAPSWSHDGLRLAATQLPRRLGTPPSLEQSIVVVDLNDEGSRVVLGPGESPHWRSDGRIVFGCGGRLCIRSTGTAADAVPGSDGLSHPAWSPDGSLIAAWDSAARAVVVLRADGRERRVLAEASPGGPAWSADGLRVVAPTAGGLRSVSITGGDVRVVTDQPVDNDPDIGRRP